MAWYTTPFILAALFCFFLSSSFSASPVKARLSSDNTLSLSFHGGPLLHGPLSLHILWYGSFSPSQQSILTDFLSSFHQPPTPSLSSSPSIPLWWNPISLYSTPPSLSSSSTSPSLLLGLQATITPSLSLGFSLNRTSFPLLLQQSLSSGSLPTSSSSIYLILTSQDVLVENLCTSSCGFHAFMEMKKGKGKQRMPYIWAGNAAQQCPGECAWPFAQPVFGPQVPPLVGPNEDVGMDGMVINIATLLAGTVTNPFNTGFFQGDARVPMEAGSACTGLFGEGAFPGFPGRLLVSKSSGASFNVHGINNRTFLLPALWNPTTSKCVTLP
eukprot:c16849_g1_i1 orf=26-1006(+)